MGSSGNSVLDKVVMLLVNHADDRQMFAHLLKEMQLGVVHVETGAHAVAILEENPCDLLIMDVSLTDIHAWQLLAKIHEIESLRTLPAIVITDNPMLIPVVKPIVFLMRPVSLARLRQNVNEMLNASLR
jgi:response regulator RpfG family c-di-GMP phosphodiesterase